MLFSLSIISIVEPNALLDEEQLQDLLDVVLSDDFPVDVAVHLLAGKNILVSKEYM